MNALSLALALWGLLAFAGWWMWLRGQRPSSLEARVAALEALRPAARLEVLEKGQANVADEIHTTEDRRRKLSKRVGELEFRHLGKRMTPPEDEA